MDGAQRLVQTSDLETKYLSETVRDGNVDVFFRYDEDLDTVFLLFVDPLLETVTHPVDNHVALLYDPDTLEVVGVTIESFQRHFMGEANERVWSFHETGLEMDEGADLSIRFEADAWVRQALTVKYTSPEQREIGVAV